MKNKFTLRLLPFAVILLTLFAAAACDKKPETQLDKLKVERDSLQTKRAALDDQIFALDDQIAELDSTVTNKKVTIETAKPTLFKHYFDVYGNVQSDKMATLFAENPGNITRILVDEGEHVKKGQTLVMLDQGVFDSNLQELITQLDLATTLYTKQKRLWDQNVGSEVQYLEAKNRKESLENSIATLREQRSKSSVVAPFAGVVDKIFPKIGEMAGMQAPIIRIVNLDDLYLTADVSERYINSLKAGDEVSLVINRKDTTQSTIELLGSYINPINRSFEIRVNIDKANGKLRPNSLVSMKINDFTKENAIVLPASIIMQDGEGRSYVYKIGADDKGRKIASKTIITTGASYQGKTVVLEGVQPGDEIIDKGARSVRNTDLVDITTIG